MPKLGILRILCNMQSAMYHGDQELCEKLSHGCCGGSTDKVKRQMPDAPEDIRRIPEMNALISLLHFMVDLPDVSFYGLVL